MRERATMGRPREFDEDEALAAIMEVFWTKGFEGASLQDLVDATGLKKGSLYAAFGDKRAMYLKALTLYDRTRIERAVQDLKGGGPAIDRIDRFLRSAYEAGAERGDARGCFTCNASIDQAPSDPDAARLVRASLGRLEAALADGASDLKPEGRKHATRHARHLMAVYFGLRVLAKAGTAVTVLDDARRAALGTLTGSSAGP